MKNYLFVLAVVLGLLTSCSSNSAESGEGAVNEICDCLLDAGIEDESDLKDLEYGEEASKEVIKCVLPILKDVRDELSEMKDEERSDYFGDAIKAAVDCECGQNLLLAVAKAYDKEDIDEEFEDLIDEMEDLLGEKDHDHGYGGDFFGPSVDICDCVNMYQGDDPPSDEMQEACEELMQDFEDMSSAEQEELIEIVTDCMDNY